MWLKQSTTVTVSIGPFVDITDGVTEETGLAGTMTVSLSKAGAVFAARNSATAIAHDTGLSGHYRVELNATDTNMLGPLRVAVHAAATHLPVWREFMVVDAKAYEALVTGTAFHTDNKILLGGTTHTGATIPTVSINSDMRGTDSAMLAASYVAPDNTGISNIQSRLPTALVGNRMDANVGAISGSVPAADNLEAHALEVNSVTFTGGSTTTAILGTVDGVAASAANSVYNSRLLIFNSGSLDKQVAQITAYDGTTKVATISAVTTAVSNGDTAILI